MAQDGAPTPVLIAGAGPTGLVLALALARRGVPVRIVDDGAGPGEFSRATVVHARTLEFYRQFGFGDEVVVAGIPLGAARVREAAEDGAREVMRLDLAEVGAGLSPYPLVLAFPQDDHERLLVGKLRAAGVEVEWNTVLTGFVQEEGGVVATLARGGTVETARAPYLCGCDGARSQVRRSLGIEFSGGTYAQRFFVADAELEGGFRRDLVISLGANSLGLLFPVRSSGTQRLLGLVPPALAETEGLTFQDVRASAEALLGVRVAAVRWFSAYRVHHRVASHFRAGRAFLLGDAGHVHSPVGGQGMNTGIGDAVNLGWKLAQVLAGRAPAALLDSYEAERLPFARSLVATTDRAFQPLVAEGLVGEATRRFVAPLLFAAASRLAAGRHAFFRTVSQIRIHYADSPLSEGEAGGIRGGDRLPWVPGADVFAPLRSLDWQVHVHGGSGAALEEACAALGLPVHAFPWGEAAGAAGYARDAATLVRPDGHVALAAEAAAAPAALAAYAARLGLRFG